MNDPINVLTLFLFNIVLVNIPLLYGTVGEIVVEKAGSVLSIPVEAVSRGNIATVADPGALSEDGLSVVDPTKLREVEVVLGRSDGAYIEVLEGLSEGDIVVSSVQPSSSMMF